MTRKKKIALALIALIILIFGASKIYAILSPEYTLQKIRLAVETKDTTLLKSYVNLDSLELNHDYRIIHDSSSIFNDAFFRRNPIWVLNDFESYTKSGRQSDNYVGDQILSEDGYVTVRAYSTTQLYRIPIYSEIRLRRQGLKYVAVSGSAKIENNRIELINHMIDKYGEIKAAEKIYEYVSLDFSKSPPNNTLTADKKCKYKNPAFTIKVKNISNKKIEQITYILQPKASLGGAKLYNANYNILPGRQQQHVFCEDYPAGDSTRMQHERDMLLMVDSELEVTPESIAFANGDKISTIQIDDEPAPSLEKLIDFLSSYSPRTKDSISTWRTELIH